MVFSSLEFKMVNITEWKKGIDNRMKRWHNYFGQLGKSQSCFRDSWLLNKLIWKGSPPQFGRLYDSVPGHLCKHREVISRGLKEFCNREEQARLQVVVRVLVKDCPPPCPGSPLSPFPLPLPTISSPSRAWELYHHEAREDFRCLISRPPPDLPDDFKRRNISQLPNNQCPAGNRTRPATRYFFRYPTRPNSVLEIVR